VKRTLCSSPRPRRPDPDRLACGGRDRHGDQGHRQRAGGGGCQGSGHAGQPGHAGASKSHMAATHAPAMDINTASKED